jgi:hypothetical protein
LAYESFAMLRELVLKGKLLQQRLRVSKIKSLEASGFENNGKFSALRRRWYDEK